MQRVTQHLAGEGWCYTNAREKRFLNATPASVTLGKKFRNGVLACSVTKIPDCNIACKQIKLYNKGLWNPYLLKQCTVYLAEDCSPYGSTDEAMLHMALVLLLISSFGDLIPLLDK
jgi:hypothetical protein